MAAGKGTLGTQLGLDEVMWGALHDGIIRIRENTALSVPHVKAQQKEGRRHLSSRK
jgi:hypothetical protein